MRFFAFVFIAVTASCAFAQESQALNDNPITISSVRFTGNNAFNEDRLQGVIQTHVHTSGLWRFFTGTTPSYLNYLTIQQDSITIQSLYQQFGYLFTRVHPSVTIDTPNLSASVTFNIEEGIQCTIDTVSINGLSSLTSDEHRAISGIMTLYRGNPYSRSRLMDSLNAVVIYLRNNGYRFAHLSGSPRVRLNNDRKTVSAFSQIDVGGKYYFGRVDVAYDSISSLQCFAEEAVLQELEFKDGDVYSEAKQSKSEDNLMRFGPFESARIELRTQDADTHNVAPVIVHLKLRKQIEFSPDFVVDNNNYGITNGALNTGISATVADHNMFCAGQEGSLSGTYEIQQFALNKNRLDLEAKFLQPRIRIGSLMDYKKTSLQLGLGVVSTTFPLDQIIYSASILLSHREAEHTYLFYQLSYVQAQTKYDSAHAQQLAQLYATNPQSIQKQPNLLASISLTRDNTDNLFVPTRGSSGVVTIKVNTLPTPYYWKIEATQKWFVPWGTQSVFGFRLHGGIIDRFGQDPQRDIILDEKFYVGGSNSLRGWALYQLGVGVPYDSLFGKTGYTIFEANAEWRYKWFILPDSWINRVLLNRISSDFFIDAGNIWSEREKWDWVKQMPQQIAVAIGFGMRYDTPVGPLRIDFGYKLYDPDTQSLQHLASFDGRYPFMHLVHPQLQIAIGNAF